MTRPIERAWVCTILGHVEEKEGNIEKARDYFEDAVRHDLHGSNERRDLQRFLKAHGLGLRKEGLMLPVKAWESQRGITLPDSRPEDEGKTLEALAWRFEREGKLTLAVAAMTDRFRFDPGDLEIYGRLQRLLSHPTFQEEKLAFERRQTPAGSMLAQQTFKN